MRSASGAVRGSVVGVAVVDRSSNAYEKLTHVSPELIDPYTIARKRLQRSQKNIVGLNFNRIVGIMSIDLGIGIRRTQLSRFDE